MHEFSVSVQKVTDIGLMRQACEMTFLGHSVQSLSSIYKSEHSPARTQMFWVSFINIPLFVATHLLRHHVGSTPYQLTCREDRKGGNPNLIGHLDAVLDKLSVMQQGYENADHDLIDSDDFEFIRQQLDWCKENTDRLTPVNLGLFLNAQSLIDMAKLRLCNQAHKDTVTVFKKLKEAIADVDPDLAALMVRKCVYRNGLCGEPHCCGFNTTIAFNKEKAEYLKNFHTPQCGAKQTPVL